MAKIVQDSVESTGMRQRMEQVRCDLDQDVQEIVEGARDLRDWRAYVRSPIVRGTR